MPIFRSYYFCFTTVFSGNLTKIVLKTKRPLWAALSTLQGKRERIKGTQIGCMF